MNKWKNIQDKFLPNCPLTEVVVCERRTDGVYTNVPHRIIQHSPCGYEFGYGGSGPADLALNLCEAVFHHIGYDGPRVVCWEGKCFEAAYAIHQQAKHYFIAPLPREGGRIPFADVVQWVTERLAEAEQVEGVYGRDD
jgi:hypothetical protein